MWVGTLESIGNIIVCAQTSASSKIIQFFIQGIKTIILHKIDSSSSFSYSTSSFSSIRCQLDDAYLLFKLVTLEVDLDLIYMVKPYINFPICKPSSSITRSFSFVGLVSSFFFNLPKFKFLLGYGQTSYLQGSTL